MIAARSEEPIPVAKAEGDRVDKLKRRRRNARHHPVVGVRDNDPAILTAIVSGISAILCRANAPPDYVAEHDDASVGRGEVLQAVP